MGFIDKRSNILSSLPAEKVAEATALLERAAAGDNANAQPMLQQLRCAGGATASHEEKSATSAAVSAPRRMISLFCVNPPPFHQTVMRRIKASRSDLKKKGIIRGGPLL